MRIIAALIKIVVVAAVVNAAARMGIATWKNVELKNSAQQAVLFGRERPPDELLAGVIGKAMQLELPITEEQISISQQETRTAIDIAYENPVEVFPNYIYPMKFSFTVESFKTR